MNPFWVNRIYCESSDNGAIAHFDENDKVINSIEVIVEINKV